MMASKEIIIDNDSSERVDLLLEEGVIEKLAQEGRAPCRIGSLGGVDKELQPYYQVPPKRASLEKINSVYMGAVGALVFVFEDGSQEVGPTFTLTPEQASQVDQRVESTLKPIDSF